MNKTFLNLNYKNSLILLSSIGILFALLSNVYYVNGFLGVILYVLRFSLFILFFIAFYLLERYQVDFKEASKRMIGYLGVCAICNCICSIFVVTNLLKGLFLTCSGVVCLWCILSFVIEIFRVYKSHKFVEKWFQVNKKIGSFIANPILSVVSKITNG